MSEADAIPPHGILARVACQQTPADLYDPTRDTLPQLVHRLIGARHIFRDIMENYPMDAEDAHDFALADLRVSQIVQELRNRYDRDSQMQEQVNLQSRRRRITPDDRALMSKRMKEAWRRRKDAAAAAIGVTA